MKVIDLLNKIANGEAPNKIKYRDEIWTYGCGFGNVSFYEDKRGNLFSEVFEFCILNDEVEIIDKKIEKIILISVDEYGNEINFVPTNEELQKKINELIDEVNKLKEDK